MLPESGPDRRSTLVDVARLSGTSHQTVSRFFRDGGKGMKADTRDRIQQAVTVLNYHPNLIARSMRAGHTNRLAVIVPAAMSFLPARMIGAAASTAHEHGFTLEVVSVEGGSDQREERIESLVKWGQVDGILSISPLNTAMSASAKPVVVIANYDDDMRALGELADASVAAEIIEHLARLGHVRFLHIAGSREWSSARNRRIVYQQTIDRLGLESWGIVDGDWSARSGYEAVMALPEDSGVTAIFAASDVVAMGVLRAAHIRGWTVPGDISLWGWDDEDFAQYSTPALSSVNVDREAEGRNAMLRLIAAVRNEPAPEIPGTPISRLVVRESVGPPRASQAHGSSGVRQPG